MIKKYFLLLLPFTLPLYVVRFHIGPIPTTLLEVIVLISFSVWLYTKETTPNPSLARMGKISTVPPLYKGRLGGVSLPVLLFLIAGIISIFVAPDKISALGLFRAYFIEPLLVFVMLRDIIKTEKDHDHLFLGLLGITFLISFWTILQRLGILQIPLPWNTPPQGIRATGPFPFPNAVALFVVPLGALFISSIKTQNAIRSTLYILGFLSALTASFLAQSDGGMIALIAAAGVTLLINKKSRIPTLIASAIICIGILTIPSIRTPIEEKIFFRDWSGKVRLVIWDETTRMLRDRPIQGAGLGAYPEVITEYDHATWMEIFQYPHNIILNFWSELGFLGIIAFGWILIRWYQSNPEIVLPILTALLIHGLVDVPYFKNDLAILFWMLIIVTTWTKHTKTDKLAPQS